MSDMFCERDNDVGDARQAVPKMRLCGRLDFRICCGSVLGEKYAMHGYRSIAIDNGLEVGEHGVTVELWLDQKLQRILCGVSRLGQTGQARMHS